MRLQMVTESVHCAAQGDVEVWKDQKTSGQDSAASMAAENRAVV